MTMTPVKETHIYLDEGGTACVDSPRNKVKMLVQMVAAYGGVEQTAAEFPHLSLAQLYAAMSYYHDHKSEIDEVIRKDNEFVEKMRAETPECEATKRVRKIMEGR